MSDSGSGPRSRLVVLYEQMSQHTSPECASSCRAPHSCCSPEYCECAIEEAATVWGVQLERTGHPRLPLMGAAGCTAAPHLRPMCTLHTCAIGNLGFKPGDQVWTDRYFELRQEIDRLSYGLHE